MFSIEEIIDLAIQIERNAESVYRKALKKISDPAIASWLQWLADEEVRHVQWFSSLKQTTMKGKEDTDLTKISKPLLQEILGKQIFSLMDADFSKIDRLQDLFALMIEFEKDTVIFFQMILSFVHDKQTLKHLKTIIEEEHRHVHKLEEFLTGKTQPSLRLSKEKTR